MQPEHRSTGAFSVSGRGSPLGLVKAISDALFPPALTRDALNAPIVRDPIAIRGAYDPDRVFEPLAGRQPSWSLIEGDQLADTAHKVGVVCACISLLADAVSESPIRVYTEVNGEKTEQPNHRARQVLANPNPTMSEAEFLALVVSQMAFVGYAVIEKSRSGGGIPVQLWPLRADWLTSRTAETYAYRVSGQPERLIPRDDLILLPYRHDDRHERLGISPLHAIGREIGIESSLTDFLKTFLDAGGIPPFVLTHADPIDDPLVVTQIQEQWRTKYGGSKAYGNLPVLHGGYAIEQIGGDLNSMAWPDLRAVTETRIAQAFRVPGELIQTRDAMQSGGLETTRWMGAMRYLQLYGATPLRARIDGALTRGFLADFTGGDPTLSLEFDTSDVLGLQEDRDAVHERARADLTAGGITLAEFRSRIGEKDLGTASEVFYLPFNIVPTPLAAIVPPEPPKGSVTVQPPAAIAPGKALHTYRDHKALSPAELETRATALGQARRTQTKLTQILDRQMRRFFVAQGKRIVGRLEKSTWPVERRDVADALGNWDEETDELRKVLGRFYAVAGEAAFGDAAALLGVSIAWDLANPNTQRVIERLGHRIVGISETTRADVAKVVSDGLAEGVSMPELSQRLEGMFEQTYRGRSMAIARTESMVSYGHASQLGYIESGVVDEVEVSDNPDHVESYAGAADGLTCAQRHGITVPVTQGTFHVESDHPNGSATLIPLIRTPLGQE